MLDMLEVIEPETIDSVVCDPPYELNFMGKGWDNSGIAFQPDTWKKCYEVLKPGGYLLAFGGSRTFHRIACAIEDAGFEIRDTIMWLYGSGFPKSMDISKQIDKRPNKTYEAKIRFGELVKEYRNKSNLTQRQLGELIGVSRELINLYEIKGNNQQQIPTKEQWKKIKKILNIYDDMDYIYEEAEREVIGTKQSGCFNSQEKDRYTIGSSKSLEVDITIPSTDLAKQWQGWGTALKPSFEPIIVARKPFKGSLVDNVIEYGVGGINIDECRVGNEVIKGGTMPDFRDIGEKSKKAIGIDKLSFGQVENAKRKPLDDHIGRFPANTILTYDETPNDERLRYFYCAKASKKDRDEGLDNFVATTDKAKGNGLDRVCEFCGVSQLTPELCHCETKSWITKPKKNTHPTVKPTELMQYLVRLVSPDGATILDPFNGSGSTGKAVMYENKERNKNYKYIGIELTEEYLPIAKARIEYVCNLTQEELKEQQMTIFDILESKGE
jgi:DNA modification methylase